MEKQTPNHAVIRFNKRYLKLITSFLQNNQYNFSVDKNDHGSKIELSIPNLKPEDAFYLGAKAQIQLMEGESLI